MRYPKWNFQKFPKKEEEESVLQAKKELDKDRYDGLMETIKEKTKLENFNLHISNAYNTVRDNRKIRFKYTVPKKSETEQECYDKWKEECPKKYVGPQHYWKYPKIKPGKKVKIPTEDDNGNKVYFMNRKETDGRIYKPMKKHIF